MIGRWCGVSVHEERIVAAGTATLHNWRRAQRHDATKHRYKGVDMGVGAC
jgi:hypothetical protein